MKKMELIKEDIKNMLGAKKDIIDSIWSETGIPTEEKVRLINEEITLFYGYLIAMRNIGAIEVNKEYELREGLRNYQLDVICGYEECELEL